MTLPALHTVSGASHFLSLLNSCSQASFVTAIAGTAVSWRLSRRQRSALRMRSGSMQLVNLSEGPGMTAKSQSPTQRTSGSSRCLSTRQVRNFCKAGARGCWRFMCTCA